MNKEKIWSKDDVKILKYALSMDEKGRVTPKEFAVWLRQSLDIEAENLFGEFGFATLTNDEQDLCFEELYDKGMIE